MAKKMVVRCEDGVEYTGDVALKGAFAIITNATQHELVVETKYHKCPSGFKKRLNYILAFVSILNFPCEYKSRWKLIKKNVRIIIPSDQIYWIEEQK